MLLSDFESALESEPYKHKHCLASSFEKQAFVVGARWAHDLLNEEIEKLKAEYKDKHKRMRDAQLVWRDRSGQWKEQAEALAGALEFYNSRTVYELLNQFQGDNTYSECHGVANGALTAYNKFKERQAAGDE